MKLRQHGLTLLGFLMVLLIAGFFAYVAMKLVPSYIEYFGVVKAMQQEAATDVTSRAIDEVRSDLIKKLNFQYVGEDVLHPEDITMTRNAQGMELRVKYDKDIHFMYNIDFLLHFDHGVRVQGSAGDQS